MKRLLYCIVTILLGLCCFTACKGDDESSSSQSSQSEQTSQNDSGSAGVEITQSGVEVSVGESVQLETIVENENIFLFWSVRDENIATVSDEGLVTGVAEGQTICYVSYGSETAMCLVKVLPEKAKPLLSAYSPYQEEGIKIFVGDAFNPAITVKLGDSVFEDAQIEYVVTGSSVRVEDGILIADGVGNATVAVKVTYGEQMVQLSLSVAVIEN